MTYRAHPKTNGCPLASKKDAKVVQDQPPDLLSISLCPVPTAGAWLSAYHCYMGQRGLQAVVYGCLWQGWRSLLRLSALGGSGRLFLTKQPWLAQLTFGAELQLPLQGLDVLFFFADSCNLLHALKPDATGISFSEALAGPWPLPHRYSSQDLNYSWAVVS